MTLNRPVFLVTTGENGIGLVQGMLDGHPQLATLPFLCDFAKLYEKHQSDGAEKLAGAVVRYPILRMIFEGRASYAYGDFRGMSFSADAAKRRYLDMHGGRTPTRKEFVEAWFHILCDTFGISTKDRRPVIHVHFPEWCDRYMQDFPDASWIVCTAKPENMDAFFAFSMPRTLPKGNKPLADQWAERCRVTKERLAAVASLPPEQTLHVPFEEVLTTPTSVAANIAAFLGIADHVSLRSSTALGRPLTCTYPTGSVEIRNGVVLAPKRTLEILLGRVPVQSPPKPRLLRLRWYHTQAAPGWRGPGAFLREAKISVRQCMVEMQSRNASRTNYSSPG